MFLARGGWKPVPACIAHHLYYQFPVTRGHCSTSSRCVNMANFRTVRGKNTTVRMDVSMRPPLCSLHCVERATRAAGSRDVVCRTRML